jgi:hypothetical protein
MGCTPVIGRQESPPHELAGLDLELVKVLSFNFDADNTGAFQKYARYTQAVAGRLPDGTQYSMP